jgi:hypothetical protein
MDGFVSLNNKLVINLSTIQYICGKTIRFNDKDSLTLTGEGEKLLYSYFNTRHEHEQNLLRTKLQIKEIKLEKEKAKAAKANFILENMIKYAPDGSGALDAQADYNQRIIEQAKNILYLFTKILPFVFDNIGPSNRKIYCFFTIDFCLRIIFK